MTFSAPPEKILNVKINIDFDNFDFAESSRHTWYGSYIDIGNMVNMVNSHGLVSI